MAFIKVEKVRIAGIGAAVPKAVRSNIKENDKEGAEFIASTGVKQRHYDSNFTTSDLCEKAAEKLLEELKWNKDEIDALFFVSQTADYILPATACILQDKLGLPKSCAAMDISMGCSGWVYGMSVMTSLVRTGGVKKAILCSGDTNTIIQDDDRLFGDAGTVTALEYDEKADPIYFNLGTDGSGADAIMIPHGGARHYFDESSLSKDYIDGHWYKKTDSRMKGMDVFAFGISTVPRAVKSLAENFNYDYLESDFFVFHQANMMMNKVIDKKLKLPMEKTLYSIEEFGNTSSASIPLTIVSRLPKNPEREKIVITCCGFGVGLSWGVATFTLRNITIPKLIEVE